MIKLKTLKTFEMQLAEINKIQIKPITNQSEFKEANKIIDLLIDANLIEDKKVRKRSLDILEAVSILANEYEKKHFPIPKPNPIEAIKEKNGATITFSKGCCSLFWWRKQGFGSTFRKTTSYIEHDSVIEQKPEYFNRCIDWSLN